MKSIRIAALLLVLAAIMSFAACKKDEKAGDTNTDNDVEFNYSEGINDDGYFSDIRALDHVALPEYRGIEVPASEVEPSDAEVTSKITSELLENYKNITDRAVKDGDTVNIDYVGSVDGVEFSGGSTQGNGTDVTIGVTSYIDDFLEQLIGHMPGETINVEVTFPDSYPNNTDLEGKDALFVTTINYIVGETPALTDAFVAEKLSAQYGWTTAADVREHFADVIRETNITNYTRTWLIDNSVVNDVPEFLIEYEKKVMRNYYMRYATAYGMELDDFLSQQNMGTFEELVANQMSSIESAAKTILIVTAVAEKEGFSATEDEVRAYLEKGTETEVTDELLNTYVENVGMPYLKQLAIDEKVYDLIASSAVVVEDASSEPESAGETEAATDGN